jgi:hypothetical protein
MLLHEFGDLITGFLKSAKMQSVEFAYLEAQDMVWRRETRQQ